MRRTSPPSPVLFGARAPAGIAAADPLMFPASMLGNAGRVSTLDPTQKPLALPVEDTLHRAAALNGAEAGRVDRRPRRRSEARGTIADGPASSVTTLHWVKQGCAPASGLGVATDTATLGLRQAMCLPRVLRGCTTTLLTLGG